MPVAFAQVRNLEQDNQSLRQVVAAQRRKRGDPGKGGGDGGSDDSWGGQRLLSDAGDEDEARAGALREAVVLQVWLQAAVWCCIVGARGLGPGCWV